MVWDEIVGAGLRGSLRVEGLERPARRMTGTSARRVSPQGGTDVVPVHVGMTSPARPGPRVSFALRSARPRFALARDESSLLNVSSTTFWIARYRRDRIERPSDPPGAKRQPISSGSHSPDPAGSRTTGLQPHRHA